MFLLPFSDIIHSNMWLHVPVTSPDDPMIQLYIQLHQNKSLQEVTLVHHFSPAVHHRPTDLHEDININESSVRLLLMTVS